MLHANGCRCVTCIAAENAATPVTTQAGALQAVELCDEQVREGFRAYDWQIRGARHQTPWQLWRDGAFWAIRAVNSGALAAAQPNAAPAAAIDAREREAVLPPMTCKHSNRSDCALFGSEETPVKFQRPSREWYASKIQETLDDDFLIGAQAPADIPPPSAAERGLTKAERQMMDYLFSNMGHLTDAEWRQHGFRRATFDRLEKKLSDYRPALASRSQAPAARPNAAGLEQGWMPIAGHDSLRELHDLLYAAQRIEGEQRDKAISRARVIVHHLRDNAQSSLTPEHLKGAEAPPLEAVGSSGMTADQTAVTK